MRRSWGSAGCYKAAQSWLWELLAQGVMRAESSGSGACIRPRAVTLTTEQTSPELSETVMRHSLRTLLAL